MSSSWPVETKDTSYKTAKLISVLGHPFVLLPLTVVIAMLHRAPPEQVLTICIIVVVAAVFPLLLIIRRQVRAGKWSDHDISDSSERRKFYPVALIVLAISGLIFYLLDFPPALLSGMLISLLLVLTAMIINLWSKISLHLIFAVYFAVGLFAVNWWTGIVFLTIAAAVGWSRVTLGRHSLRQVLSGALLGAIGGILLLKLNNFF